MEISPVRQQIHNLRSECGLTLIEVLIALAIIGIAMTAIIKAATQNVKFTAYLQDKTIAMWVGQQVINEARAGLIHLGKSSGNQKLSTEMFGRDWYWQLNEENTPSKAIKKLTVKVFASEETKESDVALLTLESYRYEEKTA